MLQTFTFFYKTSYSNKVNCTEPPPSVGIPWPMLSLAERCNSLKEGPYSAKGAKEIQLGNCYWHRSY